jgi:hypothetical protein
VCAQAHELIALRAAPGAKEPARHSLQCSSTHPARTFAHLVIRLPSDSCTGSVTVQHDGQTLACAGLRNHFGATVAAAYTDCTSWVACAAPGYAVFVVCALCLTQVRSKTPVWH